MRAKNEQQQISEAYKKVHNEGLISHLAGSALMKWGMDDNQKARNLMNQIHIQHIDPMMIAAEEGPDALGSYISSHVDTVASMHRDRTVPTGKAQPGEFGNTMYKYSLISPEDDYKLYKLWKKDPKKFTDAFNQEARVIKKHADHEETELNKNNPGLVSQANREARQAHELDIKKHRDALGLD